MKQVVQELSVPCLRKDCKILYTRKCTFSYSNISVKRLAAPIWLLTEAGYSFPFYRNISVPTETVLGVKTSQDC